MLSVESISHDDADDEDEAATCSTDVTVATVGTSSCYSNPATTATTTATTLATGEEDEKTKKKKKQQRKPRNRKAGTTTVIQADEFSFLFGDVILRKKKKTRHRRKRNDNTIVASSTTTTTTPASMGNSREDWNDNHCRSDKDQEIDRYDEEEEDSEAGMEVDVHGIVDSSSTTAATATAAAATSISTPREDLNDNNWSSDEEQAHDDDDEENEDSEAGMEVDVHGIVTEVAGKRLSHKQRVYQVRQTFLRKAKIATVGGSMVVLGVAMIAVPGGPSVPTVVAGLRVLGTEFACAKTAEANVVHATNQVVDQSKQFCARALDHHATTNPNVFQTLATTKTHFVERHPHLVQSAHQAKVTCLQHLGSAQVEYEKRRFAFIAAQ